MNLVEYIGPEGVRTTPEVCIPLRLRTPYPGDVVDFSLVMNDPSQPPYEPKLAGLGTPVGNVYPYLYSRWGTIEGRGVGMANDDEFHICVHPGSIFLSWDSQAKRPSVSISGGPFECVKADRLVWPSQFYDHPKVREANQRWLESASSVSFEQFRNQRMWNWGDLGSGAGRGVYYNIERPVWILLP